MNTEKMNEIAAAIGTFGDEAKTLLEMELPDAVKCFQEHGYSFTEEELALFADEIRSQVKNGELDEQDLENVSGGCFGAIALGVAIGGGAGIIANWVTGRWSWGRFH